MYPIITKVVSTVCLRGSDTLSGEKTLSRWERVLFFFQLKPFSKGTLSAAKNTVVSFVKMADIHQVYPISQSIVCIAY